MTGAADSVSASVPAGVTLPDTDRGGERHGLVVMAYGTPSSREDVLPYYTDIRRGRPPSDEQLADLLRRYEAIGGLSPLTERTEAQRAALAAALERRQPGRFDVAVGLRHVEPRIEAAVAELAGREVDDLVGLVLAPHHSSMSIAVYLDRAARAAEEHGLPFTGIESWATEPAYVAFLADAVCRRLAELPARTHVVFTAHSLPERILAAGDRYPDELAATAGAVAAATGLGPRDERWSIGWQSAGRTPEPWIGPDILEVIDRLAAATDEGGARAVDSVLVCPCGFVADHLEVLYDLDIEARRRAEAAGLAFARTPVMNDDADVLDALAARVVAARR